VRTTVFGPAGIEDQIRTDIDLLLKVPQGDLEKLCDWLAATPKPIPLAWSDIAEIVQFLSLEPREANRVLTVLRYLLTNSRAFRLTSDGVRTDIEAAGYKHDEAERVIALLTKLEGVKERVYRSAMRRGYEIKGLPTLDDVNMMWDIRPMFEEFAYDRDPEGQSYEKFVGHTNVLILELLASRETNEQVSVTFQLSEDEFDKLSRAIDRAKRQLEIAKREMAL